jgi:coenzyme F420-0:L-glutamate ligase/coenzyme F420-1:gamma-L-glutamate ligase
MSMPSPALSLFPLPGLPVVQSGDDLAELIVAALRAADLRPQAGDILAVTQKIVSKAEGRVRRLAQVMPSARALELAGQSGKDPRLVELILEESNEVLRCRSNVLIVEHRLGFVIANAGIDRSNVAGGDDTVLLLPLDPDASAARLRERLAAAFGVKIGVIITDSVGRAWRMGTVGIAIGAAGVSAFQDLRGRTDLFGRALQVSEIAPADSLAAAAVLVMGEAAENTPVALLRGYALTETAQPAGAVLRPRRDDMFR